MPRSLLGFADCPGVIINSPSFHSHKCPSLVDQFYGPSHRGLPWTQDCCAPGDPLQGLAYMPSVFSRQLVVRKMLKGVHACEGHHYLLLSAFLAEVGTTGERDADGAEGVSPGHWGLQ